MAFFTEKKASKMCPKIFLFKNASEKYQGNKKQNTISFFEFNSNPILTFFKLNLSSKKKTDRRLSKLRLLIFFDQKSSMITYNLDSFSKSPKIRLLFPFSVKIIAESFLILKNIDLCLLELQEDVIETGKINKVLLQTICLPEKQASPGSHCITSGLRTDSKEIHAVSLNLFNETYCDEHSLYSHFGTVLNDNQLCAGLPSKTQLVAPFNGIYQEDFGGPLICLDKTNQEPLFTGLTSSNSFSTKSGYPGLILLIFLIRR